MGLEQNLGVTLSLLKLQSSLLLSLFWEATPVLAVFGNNLQNYTFSHTLFCQNGESSLGLSENFNGDHLFSFDFSKNSRVPRLPEFAAWATDKGDIESIDADKNLCQELQHKLRIPVAEVFTLEPLEFGKPNTLVCFVSNFFPPRITVTWQHEGVSVESSSPTFLSATDELNFQAFSYLNITPKSTDVFSCTVAQEGDLFSTIAFWVPQNPIPSALLENILCGIAFGLGIVGIIVGASLIIYFQKPCVNGAD